MITYDNLRSFCYSNDREIKGEIKGLLISFMGLGNQTMVDDRPQDNSAELAQNGIIYVVPYLDPWNWMNDMAVKTADLIIDTLKAHYHAADLKVGVMGESMGGYNALVFSRFSHHHIVSCVTLCPVCDGVFHITERPDLPRTFWSAYGNAPDFEAELKKRSPYQNADQMRDIYYVFFHTAGDKAVHKELHSDKMVMRLKELGKNVRYYEREEGVHCQLCPKDQVLYREEAMKELVSQ